MNINHLVKKAVKENKVKEIDMLTEYNGKVFNAEINGNKISIWKYIPVEGFNKVTTRRGITYYEKVVDVNDVNSFFSVSFIAVKNNMQFTVKSFVNGKIEVICDDCEYAKTHNFTEIEHGVWCSRNTVDDYEKFQLIKSIQNSNERVVKDISQKDFSEAWKKYVKEVGI